MHYYAVGLSIVFLLSILYSKSLPYSETILNEVKFMLYFAFFTLERISSSLAPLNGGLPLKKIYNMTPQDQMSHLIS